MLYHPPQPPSQETTPLAGDERIVLRDEIELDRSVTLVLPGPDSPIEDTGSPGVVRITAPDITVTLEGTLCGTNSTARPDTLDGVGILISAPGVTLRGGAVSGFRVGILARASDSVTLEDIDVSGNRRDRLGSTSRREDGSDWLWPHENDDGQWLERYGAGIAVVDTSGATVRNCRARRGQNGLVLDRVAKSLIYDNDFSFLSGWGIAMWRSSGNSISRNALDFCIRGYSHGTYNRGQDSAGLLLFEQCSNNLIVENSITHGGDGIFAFSGREALGEVVPEGERDVDWYVGRGNSGNTIARNDLSYCAAHGLELTFAFANQVFGNRFVENAICGIWGGYSRDTLIVKNLFSGNGDAGYGLERGGIDIEHGQRNVILENRFEKNTVGVHLFWDADPGLVDLPWVKANGFGSGDNLLIGNQFEGDRIAIQLRAAGPTTLAGNEFEDVGNEVAADEASQVHRIGRPSLDWEQPEVPVFGRSAPIGARDALAGRQSILVGEWGPYDYESPVLWPEERTGAHPSYLALGGELGDVSVNEGITLERSGDRILLSGPPNTAVPYHLRASVAGAPFSFDGVLLTATWHVRFFASSADPRRDLAAWRAGAEQAQEFELESLDLAFGSAGPGSVVEGALDQADHFGTRAWATITLPAGTWTIRTVSDDGIRVSVDGEVVTDDWTLHGATRHEATIELDEAREVAILVEHFELDGAATLEVSLVPAVR
ncbi:MAG TPA: hypothetical protein ENJ09_04245 [Planctomycetes bacterium]|nr:hypothetical protein [Planctomycetota bacterium]